MACTLTGQQGTQAPAGAVAHEPMVSCCTAKAPCGGLSWSSAGAVAHAPLVRCRAVKPLQSPVMGHCMGCRYACTKWAGEVLAREAAGALGLPVTVHRCGLITAHTTCAAPPAPACRAACADGS